MNVTIIGAGYVGLVTGACLAESEHTVHTIDINEEKIALLKKGKSPIFEAGLEELIHSGQKSNRLSFSTDLSTAVDNSDLILICVNTPPKEDGSADLTFLHKALDNLIPLLDETKVLVLKSTVPVGTGKAVQEKLKDACGKPIHVVSNPEFLRQGSAVHDFLYPDRVVLGGTSKWALDMVEELHHQFLPENCQVIRTNNTSAELTKYAANAFLAAKISFINYFSLLADRLDADVRSIQAGVAADPRIGPAMLHPGIGYGGSCLPKDLCALTECAKENDVPTDFLQAVANINLMVRTAFVQKLRDLFHGELKGKKIGIWGLSFKPETDDLRAAPSLPIIKELLSLGAEVSVYDPEAMKNVKTVFGDDISYASSQYDAVKGADALLVLTEWSQFKSPSFAKIRGLMKSPNLFDGRHIYDPVRVKQLGLNYFSLGASSLSRG